MFLGCFPGLALNAVQCSENSVRCSMFCSMFRTPRTTSRTTRTTIRTIHIRSPPWGAPYWGVLMVLETILVFLVLVLVVLEVNIEHRTLFSEQ